MSDREKENALHPFNTSEAIHDEKVALFMTPPINEAENKVKWIEHDPSFMNQKGYSAVQFNIAGTGPQYTDLSRTYLKIKLKITDEDGETLFVQNEDQSALPIDQILHSMWSNVEIRLNQVLVTSSDSNYMYKAYLKTLLNYNTMSKEKQLHSIGFTGETLFFDQTHPEKIPLSTGLNERKKLFEQLSFIKNRQDNQIESHWIYKGTAEFIGPLLCDICQQPRLILNGVPIDIRLIPTRDEFRMITYPDGKRAHLTIEEIKLDVCKVTVSDATYIGHDSALKESPAKYPILRTNMATYNIPAGSFGEVIEDPFQGELPTMLIVGMVESEAFHGNINLNPLAFKNFNVNKIAFFVDGESVKEPFDFDIDNNQYLDGLLSLYDAAGVNYLDNDNGITRHTYKEGCFLVAFHCDPTAAADFSYMGKTTTGRGRLRITFQQALQKSVTVLMYATFPEVVLISKERSVSLQER